MATKVGAIYVEIKGDDTQWKKDMAALRSAATQSGKNVSEALNSAINPSKASSGIKTISTGLTQLAQTAKVPEKQFKQTADAITDAFSDVANSVGMTRKEFSDLNERMLRNKAFQTATNELKSLSYAAGLSVSETKKLAQQMGYTSSQAGEMANKIHRVQQESNATIDVFSRFAVAAVAAFSIHEIVDFTNKIKDAGAELESLGFAYASITGSQSKAAKEMEYVNTTAKSLGLGLTTLEKSYKGLIASSQGTTLEGENTRKIFTALSKASSVLGLSVNDTERALYAIQQMMSKGKVYTEELSTQLLEVLPIGFGKVASSIGKTSSELSYMLKQGEVISEDFIPKFADVLERDFGKAAEDAGGQARAAFENFSTAVIELKRALAESGILEYLANVTRNATGMINEVKDAINSFNAGKMKTSVAEYDVALTKAKTNLSEFTAMWGNTRDSVPDALKERFDDLKDAVEVLSKAKDNLSRSLQNDQDWQAYGKAAVDTFGKQVSEADKAAKDIEATLKKSYEKGTEYLLAEKKKQLAIYMQYEDRKPEYVAQLQSEIAALEKKSNASSLAEQKKATAAYKKEIEEQKRAVAEFNDAHKQATLSTFDYEIDKLDEWYADQLKLVEKGLISRQDLEETYADKWFELNNKNVEEYVDAYEKVIKEQTKKREEAYKEEQRIAKESQEMRYNMLKDLGGSGYYDEQIKAIEDYAQKYVDLTKDIVTAEAWKNNEIQKLNAETALKDIKSREESFSEISSNLSAIADLYAEDSKEQQAASTAAKIAYAAEMAMLAEKNIMIAVGAVANQGTVDPYTAFARIAAMTAAMSSLLSIANIDFSAGSSGGTDVSMDKTGIVSGSGTVLGDTSALSESVSNAMETLEDIGADQYDTLVDIFYEMQDLNTNITNLATSIVQEYGSFSAESLGISEGYVSSSIEDWWTMAEGFAEKFFYIAGDLGTGWLSGLVTGWAGDIVNSIFGGGQSRNLTGAGFQVSPYVAGQDLLVQAYQDIKVEEDGGWFHSDKSWTETKLQAVDEEITKYFSSILNSFSDMAMSFVDELGVSTEEAVAAYTFDIGKINLKDLTGEEISDTLITVFSEVGDELVASLFYDAVAPYQEVGEGLLETAVRIVSEKNVVQSAFKDLGVSFNVTASDAIKFSQDLISLSGDMESFQRSFESFYDSFYSSADQQGTFINNAESTLREFDDSVKFPNTKEAFKDLVTGLDMTTESGRELYVVLMSLADGASEYYDYLSDIESFNESLQDIIDENSLSDYAQSLKAINEWYYEQLETAEDLGVSIEKLNEAYGIKLDDLELSRLSDALDDATDNFDTAKSDYIDALESEIDRYEDLKDQIQDEIDAKEDLIDTNEDLLDSFQDLKDELADFQSSLITSSDNVDPAYQLSYAKAQLDATVQKLYSSDQTEVQEALGDISGVSQTYLDLSQKMNVNELDQIRALGYVQEILNTSQDIAGVQVDRAEDNLSGLYDQNAILLENQEYYQTQIDLLTGIKEKVSGSTTVTIDLSTAAQNFYDALADLNTAQTNYDNAGTGNATETTEDKQRSAYEALVEQTYWDVLGRAGKQAGIDYWVDSLMDTTDSVDLSNFKEAFINGAIAAGELSSVASSKKAAYTTYVENLYWDVLGRAGKQAGIDYWVGALLDTSDNIDMSNIREAFINGAIAAGEIPKMASGGTVFGPTLSLIGEGGEAEHVTPDSQMQGVKERLDKIYEVLWTMLNLTGDKKESLEDLLDIFARNTQGNLPFKTEAA